MPNPHPWYWVSSNTSQLEFLHVDSGLGSGEPCTFGMTQPTKRVKLGESENKDRLSDLPESLILLILSSLESKHAVQTCVLSQRYKDLWKHLPTLILHCSLLILLRIRLASRGDKYSRRVWTMLFHTKFNG
jgi:hypothetical protein